MNAVMIERKVQRVEKTNGIEQKTRDMIMEVVKSITLHPNDVVASIEALREAVIICIKVHTGDMPRVIGKSGAHIRSLQRIVNAIAINHGKPLRLQLLEPDPGKRDTYGAFVPRKDWEREPVYRLLEEVVNEAIPGGATVTITETALATEFTIQPKFAQPQAQFNELVEACNILWNAIGKAKGRIVTVVGVLPQSVGAI